MIGCNCSIALVKALREPFTLMDFLSFENHKLVGEKTHCHFPILEAVPKFQMEDESQLPSFNSRETHGVRGWGLKMHTRYTTSVHK